MRTSKRQRRLLVAAILLLSLATAWYVWRQVTTTDDVRRGMAYVKTNYHYELIADNKTVYAWGHDSLTSSACWMDKWELLPSCEGTLAVAVDDTRRSQRYAKASPRDFLAQTIQALDSIHSRAEWRIDEFNYWARSHSVQDEGFEMVNQYNQRQIGERDSLASILTRLRGLSDKARLTIVYRPTHQVVYRDTAGIVRQAVCEILLPADTTGITLMQTQEKTLPAGAKSLPPHIARRFARMNAQTWRAAIDFQLRPDSAGVYQGMTDSLFRPHGHGTYQGYDGSYFEGHWEAGKRQGFGFEMAHPQGIRTGEWKNNQFMGERLLYTSERIYGIDISKYQHGKGRKKYAIQWDKLRITDLGNISKKRLREPADYPVRFIYIKSTEGSTVLNPYYKADYAQARKRGMKVGTYHFFSIFTPADRQARHFLKHARLNSGDLPPVLDVEPSEAQIKKLGGEKVLFERMRTWLRIVERRCGKKPILYINQQFVNRHLVNAPDLLHDYQVWIARYGEYKPDVRLAFWQLSPDGKVQGIHGDVDINVFNGYQDAYDNFLESNTLP